MGSWALLAAAIGGPLYRLRGGWLKQWINSTHACRAVWAIPTGLLLYLLAGGAWYIAPLLIASVFASMALYGHGAHMIYDVKQFFAFAQTKTELLTEWWLPQAFGGIPDTTWPHSKVTAYNISGMAFIGMTRNATAILPLSPSHEIPALIFALTGLLHGPLYWLGWRIRGDGIQAAEVLTGAVTWASIVLIFG